jgi:DNA-binding NtrC family response regulator
VERAENRSAAKGPEALLVLACPSRKARLEAVLSALGAECRSVQRGREARELLQNQPLVNLVVTDATLEDANWCDILRAVVEHNPQARVVVVAPPSAGEILWSEVMWRGAYDMLVEPFSKDDARRILEGALRTPDRIERAAAAF